MVEDNDFENKITLTTEQDDQTYGGCNNGNFNVNLTLSNCKLIKTNCHASDKHN